MNTRVHIYSYRFVCACVYLYRSLAFSLSIYICIHVNIHIPPKNGEIALWPNTLVVKCKYCVSQKRNEANDMRQWHNF